MHVRRTLAHARTHALKSGFKSLYIPVPSVPLLYRLSPVAARLFDKRTKSIITMDRPIACHRRRRRRCDRAVCIDHIHTCRKRKHTHAHTAVAVAVTAAAFSRSKFLWSEICVRPAGRPTDKVCTTGIIGRWSRLHIEIHTRQAERSRTSRRCRRRCRRRVVVDDDVVRV